MISPSPIVLFWFYLFIMQSDRNYLLMIIKNTLISENLWRLTYLVFLAVSELFPHVSVALLVGLGLPKSRATLDALGKREVKWHQK